MESELKRLKENFAEQFIDEGLYSRQLYVIGHDAMRQLTKCDILVIGMDGLGAEIAKNLVLAGPRAVTIYDHHVTKISDLSTQFFLTEKDVGRNRAEATYCRLQELNSYVLVSRYSGELSKDFVSKFTVVVVTQFAVDDEKKVELGSYCHSQNIRFVFAQTCGVFGRIFCDMGEKFIVTKKNDTTPEEFMVKEISQDSPCVVTCSDVKQHCFSKDDFVKFSGLRGVAQLNDTGPYRIKEVVEGSNSIIIEADTRSFPRYEGGGSVIEASIPTELHYVSLENALLHPTFTAQKYQLKRQHQLHAAFESLQIFIKKYGEIPKPRNEGDKMRFFAIAEEYWKKRNPENSGLPIEEQLQKVFASVAAANIAPVQSIIGGIAAQEAIKACTGTFMPIQQWWYFDALECLPPEKTSSVSESTCAPQNCRYDGQIAIFGREFQRKIGDVNMFLVGAGAVGCEMLKNWALMGIAASGSGKVTVTDCDHIEKSNLNRQFLFRQEDIQKPKSSTAAAAVQRMNPSVRIQAFENRVGPESKAVFNDDFFEELTCVVSALDNVESRLYLDNRCVYYRKPLLEGGTTGTSGSFQAIIPNLTETYSKRPAPKAASIPMCTVVSFPTSIEHTIEWAKIQFEELFSRHIQDANSYLAHTEGFIENLETLPDASQMEKLVILNELLVDCPKTFDDCVTWARRYWQKEYSDNIRQMTHLVPSDYVMKHGELFWSGKRLFPKELIFDSTNDLHVDFIIAASNLLAQVYGIPHCQDRDNIAKVAAETSVQKFIPLSRPNSEMPEDESEAVSLSVTASIDPARLQSLKRSLPAPGDFNKKLQELQFDKDDDKNYQIDFITAASNLRAEVYSIPPADRHKSKGIAGQIIPALATTTSVVVGYLCLELYKILQGFQAINVYKEGMIDLALMRFRIFQARPAQRFRIFSKEFSIWDQIEIDEEMTVGQLYEHCKKQHGLDVDAIIIHDKQALVTEETLDENRDKSLREVFKEAGEPIPAYVKFLEFSILYKSDVEPQDEDDDDPGVELMPVKYHLRRETAKNCSMM